MTIGESYSADLGDDIVGAALLVELDTTQGFLRFIQARQDDEGGDVNGTFTDTNGIDWLGSSLISMSDISVPRNGSAPLFDIGVSYTVDPAGGNLSSIVREYGVAAIEGRKAKVYLQYFGATSEMFKAVHAPYLQSTYIMRKLNYSLAGAQQRSVSVTCEGAFPLRSKPANGRYIVTDHQRKTSTTDVSLGFMPTNNNDEESLFAI